MRLTAERPYAVLLPHREVYQPDGAGAVASCVRDMAAYSRYRRRLLVLGDAVAAPFTEPPLMPVTKAAWYYGRRTARYLAGAARSLQDLQPALVEVHNRPSYIERLRKALPQVPLILYLHNDPLSMRGFKSLALRVRILQQVDAVVCVSGYIRLRLLDKLSLSGIEDKIHVVLNGVDTAAIGFDAARTRKNEMLFVGRLIPEKGGLLFAQAAAIARAQLPEWRFVMIGAWGFRNEAEPKGYEQEVAVAMRKLGAQGEMTGYLPRAEVYARLSQAAIVVAPSLWEDPCPLAVIEAMASACAVIAAPRGGIPELVGPAGIELERMDADCLAGHMVRLAQDAAQRARYQSLARERATQHLDIRSTSASLDAVREHVMRAV